MFQELSDGYPALFEEADVPLCVQDFRHDSGLDNEPIRFVGRCKEREDVKKHLQEVFGVVSLCGPPLVGKSRLAKQICEELLQESLDCGVKLRLVYVDFMEDQCKRGEPRPSPVADRVLQNILVSEDGGKIHARPIDGVIAHVHQMCQDDGFCLILFDNCDVLLENTTSRKDFFETCVSIFTRCKRVRILTTSRQKFSLERKLSPSLNGGSRLNGFHPVNTWQHRVNELTILSVDDSVELLRNSAPSIDFRIYAEELATRCCCLPSVLLVVGDMLQRRDGIFSPANACDLFKHRSFLEFFKSELFIDDLDVRDMIISSYKVISKQLQEYWAALSFMSGCFSTSAACALLKSDNDAQVKERALIPLVDRSLLEYSVTTKTFYMQPFLRIIASEVMNEIATSDPIRERFVTYFGNCLLEINRQCEASSYGAVTTEHAHEMDNVRKLLNEAINCTENVYPVYYKVGKEAHSYLSLVAPYESIQFYNACRESAKKFGTPEEESQMLVNYGDLKFEYTGARAEECETIFEEADDLLKLYPDSDVKSELLVKQSWLFYRTGDYSKAVECCKMALAIEKKCGRLYSRLMTKILSLAGVSLNMLGQFEQAERHLKDALEMRKQMNPHHPGIAPALNNLGGLYTKWGKCEKGLHYAKASLMQRRHHHKTPHNSVARALVSVAYQVLRFKGEQGADEALGYLNEALVLRKKLCYNHQNTAYVLYYIEDSYAYKKQYDLAVQMYNEALTIHEQCFGPFAYFKEKVDIKLACIFQETGNLSQARALLAPLLETSKRKKIIAREPKYELIPKAALAMYKIQLQMATPSANKSKDILREEVLRLSALYIEDGDLDNLRNLKNSYWSYIYNTAP